MFVVLQQLIEALKNGQYLRAAILLARLLAQLDPDAPRPPFSLRGAEPAGLDQKNLGELIYDLEEAAKAHQANAGSTAMTAPAIEADGRLLKLLLTVALRILPLLL